MQSLVWLFLQTLINEEHGLDIIDRNGRQEGGRYLGVLKVRADVVDLRK